MEVATIYGDELPFIDFIKIAKENEYIDLIIETKEELNLLLIFMLLRYCKKYNTKLNIQMIDTDMESYESVFIKCNILE